MKTRTFIWMALVMLTMSLALAAAAKSSSGKNSTSGNTATTTPGAEQDNSWLVEGERRFRANCSRCHASPPRFPARMMATIVRHMRVRATITDQDMRLILKYMTE